MDLPPDSPLKKPIETIHESGKKAAAIVEDLLTLARRGVAVSNVVSLNDIIGGYLVSPEFEKLKAFHPLVDIQIDFDNELLNIKGSSNYESGFQCCGGHAGWRIFKHYHRQPLYRPTR